MRKAPPWVPLNPERGYWTYVPEPGGSTLAVTGLPADGIVHLRAHWNLVTVVRNTPVSSLSPAVVRPVLGWDAAAQKCLPLSDQAVLQPGLAYWVYAREDTAMVVAR